MKCRLSLQVLVILSCLSTQLYGGPALVLEVTYAASSPAVDGSLTDWAEVQWHTFAPDAPHCLNLMSDDGIDAPSVSKSSVDLSGEFALQWDSDWIYLATRVTDNIHSVPDSTKGNWWLNDSVSLFLDVPLDKDGPRYRLGDHTFSFIADPTYPDYGQWWRYGNESGRQIEQPSAARTVPVGNETRLAVTLTESGYQLEAAIPISILTINTPEFDTPLTGRSIGFMFLVTDVDTDVHGDFELQSQINFGGDDNDDSKWSRLYFTSPIQQTKNSVQLSGFVKYLGYGLPWIGTVQVQRGDETIIKRTDSKGQYSFALPPGSYTVTAGTQTLDVQLRPNLPIKDAHIEVPPTIARLHFPFPPNVKGGFHTQFVDKIEPILNQHSLYPIDHKKWNRIDTVHSRLFAFASPQDMLRKRIKLETDPAWNTVLDQLSIQLKQFEISSNSPVEFQIFETPHGQATNIPTGDGLRQRDTAQDHSVTGQRSGNWFHLKNFAGSYSPSINKMVQDELGYMWFGTDSALIRYDGNRAKQYNEGNTLPGRAIISLEQDRQGNIWVGTANKALHGGAFDSGGVSRFDGEYWTTFKTSDGLIQSMVLTIEQDSRENIWMGTAGGVSYFDGEQWTLITPANGLVHNMVHTIYEDHKGVLWFGTEDGVSRYDGYTWRTYSVADGLASDKVYSITEDIKGDIWFGTADGASRFDGRQFFTYHETKNDTVRAILESREGSIWFATNNGAKIFDSHTWKTFTTQDGLLSNDVLSLLQDKEGNLWFGTVSGASQYFGEQVVTFTEQNGLASNVVLSVFEDHHGNSWFGTEKGLDVFDGKKISEILDDTDSPFGAVSAITTDGFGNLWISSSNWSMSNGRWRRNNSSTGVRRYDGETWSLIPILSKTDGGLQLPSNIIETSDGSMWFGDYDNLLRIKDQTKQRIGHGIPKLEDSRGHIWVGGLHGEVIRLDGDDSFSITVGDTVGRTDTWLMDILEDRHGSIWFGTNVGLKRMQGIDDRSYPQDSLSVSFTEFTTDNGLAYHWVTSLLEDETGLLWIGTYGGGISLFDGFTFQNISMQDGLPSNIIRDLSQTKDGDILVATESGAARLEIDRTPPPVNIIAVIADQNHGRAESIKIPSTQSIIIFEFHGISFKARGDRMLYKYRLNGFESEWRVGPESRVQYTNIPSGDYTFEVYAIDRNLNYSEVPAIVKIDIHPPYMELALQGGLGLSIFGLFIAMGISLRHRTKNEEMQKKLVIEQKERISEQQTLMEKLEEANVKIQDANVRIESQNQELTHELEKAHDMQMQLMPVESPKTAAVDIYGLCRPASHVGGDFFQYFHSGEDRLLVAIADVTGHGMQAAIPAVLFSGILQNEMEESRNSEQHMARLNRSLHRALGRHTFVCCCIANIDLCNRRISLVNGGCPYPYYYRPDNGKIEEVSTGGLPLGALALSEYDNIELEISNGDVLVLCSDGIFETVNGDAIFGFERTMQCVEEASSKGGSAEQIAMRIFRAVDSYAQSEEQHDDQTIVVIKIN